MLAKKQTARRDAVRAVARQIGGSNGAPVPKKGAVRAKRSRAAESSKDGSGGFSEPMEASALIKQLGDDIDTRLKEIDPEDLEDLDADVYAEKQQKLREEAEIASGTQQRSIASFLADYFTAHGTDNSTPACLPHTHIGHNRNAVTCVAALNIDADHRVLLFGDKAGCVVAAALAPEQRRANGGASTATAASENRSVVRHVLEPRLPCAVVCIAVSDTRGARPRHNTHLERSTVDYYAVSSYVAAGGSNGAIYVWNFDTRAHLGTLHLHRQAVTGLAFRLQTHSLMSVSADRTLRVWSVPEMSSVDVFFGHEKPVNGVHCLRREMAVTAGADRTMRSWKLEQATQMEFRLLATHIPGYESNAAPGSGAKQQAVSYEVECVAMVNESLILCGFSNGALAVFDTSKRKPLSVVAAAHGYGLVGNGTGLEKEAVMMQAVERRRDGSSVGASTGPRVHGNPITAVATVPYADLAASAGCDGVVRLWRVVDVLARHDASSNDSALVCIAAIKVPSGGIINSLCFADDGESIVWACGKEPRMGRWSVVSGALNSVAIVPLSERVRRTLPSTSVAPITKEPAPLAQEARGGEKEVVPRVPLGVAVASHVDSLPPGSIALGVQSSDDDISEDNEETVDGGAPVSDEAHDDIGAFEVGEDGQLVFRMAASSAPKKVKKRVQAEATGRASASSASKTVEAGTKKKKKDLLAKKVGLTAKKGKADAPKSTSALKMKKGMKKSKKH